MANGEFGIDLLARLSWESDNCSKQTVSIFLRFIWLIYLCKYNSFFIHAKYLGRSFLVKVLRRDSSFVLYLVSFNLEKTSVISRNSLNIKD